MDEMVRKFRRKEKKVKERMRRRNEQHLKKLGKLCWRSGV